MRPWRSTWVASTTRRPAPEFASMPRCVTCQSVATPSAALYWHIGEITMRLGTSSSARRMVENRALIRVAHMASAGGQSSRAPSYRLRSCCVNLWIMEPKAWSGRGSFQLSRHRCLGPGDAGKPLAGGIDLAQMGLELGRTGILIILPAAAIAKRDEEGPATLRQREPLARDTVVRACLPCRHEGAENAL